MCFDKRTYRTVRRHATSEETPASIKTSLPNPEPVPALPGSLCSAIVVIVFKVEVAMPSAAATAAVVSPRRLLLLHLPRLLFLHASFQYPARCVVKYLVVVLLFWSRRQGPLCDLGSFIPAVSLHQRDRAHAVERALQGPRPTLIIVTRSATSTLLQRHVMHCIS
jgi:hypothetical protein